MAPSCLLYYVGINKKLKNITHHSLFFDADFAVHGNEIYTTKQYPTHPLFYVCCPSVTDRTVAPQDCENLFFLIPLAAGLYNDTEELRQQYFDMIVKDLRKELERIYQSILFAISLMLLQILLVTITRLKEMLMA